MKNTLVIETENGADCTPKVRAALADPDCQRLVFRPGRYDFHPTLAMERYLFISNNDEGLKRVAFPLFDRTDFTIQGGGAEFVFHGGILPFALVGCRNIRIQNLSLDWEVPFHGEAEVLAVHADGVDLHVPEAFPYRVVDGRLEFGPITIPFEIKNILEFDTARRETAFLARDNYGIGRRCEARETGLRQVRLTVALNSPLPSPGNTLAFMGERRDFPAMAVRNCHGVTVENTTIRHAGGMGFIAQQSTDLTLRRVTVAPPDDGSRLISTTADATHFVNCRGSIRLLDCLFENQMDDPTNIHGIYAQVANFAAPDLLDVRLRHHQQFGVEVARAGDRIELVDGDSLRTWHETTVIRAETLNKEHTRLVLEHTPPRPPGPRDVLGNLTWCPDIEIRGCLCQGNRARGFLVSTAGKILIEENRFHTPGAAILIASDAHDWFESGPVRDVLIRRNHFENCNYGVWGQAAIQVLPRIKEPDPDAPCYHRNIRIEDNDFTVFDPRLVLARDVDGLRITANRITASDAYPPQHADAPPFDTAGCRDVTIGDNTFSLAQALQTASLVEA